MTDIVERLRLMLACDPGCEGRCMDCPTSVAMAAAEEIERLRAECQRLAAEVSRAHKDALAWMERAAAARAALLVLTIHEEANARREGLEPCHEAQEARAALAAKEPGHD